MPVSFSVLYLTRQKGERYEDDITQLDEVGCRFMCYKVYTIVFIKTKIVFGTFRNISGHFSQVVWKESSELGVGVASKETIQYFYFYKILEQEDDFWTVLILSSHSNCAVYTC